MKIIETNSEQWDIKENGVGSIVVGAILAIVGVGLGGWSLAHLSTMAWWWSLVGLAVVAIGVLIILSASSRQVTLRRQGMSEVVETKVVGHKQTRLSFDASQIVSVNLDTSDQLSTMSSSHGATTTRERVSVLYVLLKDNSEVVLATSRSNGGTGGISVGGLNLSSFGKAPLSDESKRVAGFYGVPLSSRANNMGAAEAVASIVGAFKQGIAVAQPGEPIDRQTVPQIPLATMPITPLTPQPMPLATPVVAPSQSTEAAYTAQPIDLAAAPIALQVAVTPESPVAPITPSQSEAAPYEQPSV